MYLAELMRRWDGDEHPFLVRGAARVRFKDLVSEEPPTVRDISAGDAVAIIGDLDRESIATLLHAVDRRAIVVPLSHETRGQHEYFLETAGIDLVIDNGVATRRTHNFQHEYYDRLRAAGHGGLVLFSTGTTGRPKAICHDLETFLSRFSTPRPALRTLGFLLFDHIGGINTLLHVLYNRGTVVCPTERSVGAVLEACTDHDVEVLPTTPTFLRMLLLSGQLPDAMPPSLQVITYGTERMDATTLQVLASLLPAVDFRQTYGMSEVGILRVKSEARDSLYMRVGGEGVETRVEEGRLRIRSASRMLGYLNAPSPFDEEGWYDTRDLVEERDGWLRIIGRNDDVINVGGLKFLATEVERAALSLVGVAFARARGRPNPLTGQHVELDIQLGDYGAQDTDMIRASLEAILAPHMMPRRIRIVENMIGHRFKLG